MALAIRQAAIPDKPPLKKAKIKVKLKGVKKPRVLSLVAGTSRGIRAAKSRRSWKIGCGP
jgi:hypothetical protein